jgi:type IV secretory pathway VirB2 component (pilin)
MRRRLPGILVVLATILLFFAGVAVWVQRQALNTDDWVKTSNALIKDPAIQQETASYVADQLTNQTGLTDKVGQILPGRFDKLAPAIAGAIPDLAEHATLRALQSGAFQKLWERTNRIAHKQLVKAVTGDTSSTVVFDLRPMLGQVAQRIGLGANVVNALPPDRGRITIVRPKELVTARKVAHALKTLAIVLLVLSLVVFVAAVWSSHDRRRTLMQTGLGIFLAGFLLLLARRILGHVVVGDLTSAGAAQPAAQSTWDIGTSLLRQIAATVVVLGVIVMICAWLAGTGKWATRTRGWISPTLREQPVIAFTLALVALVLLLALGIIPGSSRPVAVLIYIVLVVGGVAALRRQVQAEAGS